MLGMLADSTFKLSRRLDQVGLVTREQFKEAEAEAERSERPLTAVLFDQVNGDADKLLELLGEHFGLEPVTLRRRVISPYVLQLLPKEVAEANHVVVFKKAGNNISVATVDPGNSQLLSFIKRKTGLTPKLYLTTPADIAYALQRYEGELSEEFAKIIEDSVRETRASHEPVEKLAQFVPVVKMVNSIIDRALASRASDIHIEPGSVQILVRFRVDGLLKRVVELPREMLPPMLARLKLMANLKLDEHRVPQDGRFRYTFSDRDVAVRVSVVPNLHGAKVVLRLLDTKEKRFNLKALGLNTHDLATVKREVAKPHGMVLVTGPTGSGKTTTLYTMLRMLNRDRVNICTIEDPIEYGLDGVNQMQVNPTAGLTFSNGLRALLRQDPDIVMVGEIRDRETAEIALNAAMTGHLVLSTVHTNDAFSAPQRLTEMGIQSFLVASVTNVIVGQRLVRKLCHRCCAPVASVAKQLERYGELLDLDGALKQLKDADLVDKRLTWDKVKLCVGRGCANCGDSGYQGRLGIYEFLVLDDNVRQVILKQPTADSVRRAALAQGATTMVADGLLKVIHGFTTFEEILRVTQD